MDHEPLDEADRRMIADLKALGRRARLRKLLRHCLVLVPGVPLLLVSIFTLGMGVSVGTLVAIVAWALFLERVLPDIEVV